MKKKGFTVAEIVIAILVLGGIAMLLMPVLLKDTQAQVNATALNKTYSMFQQTARSIGFLASQGKIVVGGNNADSDIATFFEALQYVTKTKKISSSDKDQQLKKYLNGYTPEFATESAGHDAILFFADTSNTVVLKNGVLVTYVLIDPVYYIIVDTNGIRSPNKVDSDIFFFEVVKNDSGVYSVHPAEKVCIENSDDWAERIGCAKIRMRVRDKTEYDNINL